ncbi:Prolipoprotein diacylglyceryl transferase [uncultured Eubacteriales bacterium]|uniref:Phosphatidylglycerol--prolipoprotein diacylglyceryl transferase n=1 Tax=uncultured Eubacteriales bacterium TaxID=172733 RepID=A0A212JWQ3_9FIRM|nr:Prolipoprotein diacylglyceryl transferase [uncultured Eubacteriales bacterium]
MINELSFPGLGLHFTLNRVAVTLFGRPIYWYAFIIITGFLLAWLYCSRKGQKLGVSDDDLTDMLIFAVPLALIGARLYYIIFYLDLYRRDDGSLDFAAMVRVWDGGLAIYGAVIVGVIVIFFVGRHKKIPFLAFADLGAFGLLIGQCIGRWGNFMNVEAYGGVTTLPWRMCSPKIAAELFGQGLVDSAGYQQIIDGTLGVHPTFFYESLWNLIGFLLLVLISRKWRKFDGQIFFSYIAWYGFGRGLIEGLRTDSLYFMNTPIRVSQVLGFASALVGGFLLVFFFLRRPNPEHLWVNRKAAMAAADRPSAQDEKEEQDNGGDNH